MTEDLLAFVTVIAIWKIIQVWVLKARIARKESEKAAVKASLERVSKDFYGQGEVLSRYMNRFGPIAWDRDPETLDREWPEEIN